MSGAVCIYGATGYTGRLIAQDLAARGVPVLLAARDGRRLEAVAADLREAGGIVAGTSAVALDDHRALVNTFASAGVLVNAAGPFLQTGAPVLRAALEAGVSYLDTTGEQPWIKRVFDDFDLDLRRAGVAAVPAMGYDYVPGDVVAHLVGASVEPVEELLVAYDVTGFEMTRGSWHSAVDLMKHRGVAYRDGSWRPAAMRPDTGIVDFPDPIGPQRVGPFASGEVLNVPRHVRTRTIRSVLSNRALDPPGPMERVVPYLGPVLGALMRSPLSGAVHAAIRRMPEGPPEHERGAATWTVMAQARGTDGASARGVIRGPDVYGLTGKLLAWAAVEVLAGRGPSSGGAHSPVTAFGTDALLEALGRFGATWELPGRHVAFTSRTPAPA